MLAPGAQRRDNPGMRAPLLAFAAFTIVGCSSGGGGDAPGDDATPTDDTATSDTPSDAGQDTPCGKLANLRISGDVIPGSTLTVSIDVPSAAGYTLAWTVSSGTLSSTTTPTVTWSLPADAAKHVAEKVKITVDAHSDRCGDDQASKELVLDWPDALRTIVVYDSARDGSKDVADTYAAFRGIPADHRCAVTTSNLDSIPKAEFATLVDTVMACATKVGPHVHTIVPVWGVPYKVSGQVSDLADPTRIVEVSLDSLLIFGSAAKTITAPTRNPIFQGKDAVGGTDSLDGTYKPYVPFGQLRAKRTADYFMVSRIDGADAAAAKALVARTQLADTAAKEGKLAGKVYVDGNKGLPHPTKDDFGSYESGEWNMIGTENVFTKYGKYPVVADYNDAEFGTAPAPLTCPDALYYAGWYSFGHYNDAFTWVTGAIGGHLDSCSACDIRGTTDWSAMALRKGITATFGAVNEPYVAGLPEYDQFFLYLTQGASYGEAGVEATTYESWMIAFIGDPLYRPYPTP